MPKTKAAGVTHKQKTVKANRQTNCGARSKAAHYLWSKVTCNKCLQSRKNGASAS